MTEFLKKIKTIVREHFPDTEDVNYHISMKILRKHPWKSRHVVLVHRDKKHLDSWQTASAAFDARENLGLLAIKNKINVLVILQDDEITQEENEPMPQSEKDVQ